MFEVNEIIEKALVFAALKHNGQYRKGDKKTDYISHPINVTKKLLKMFEFDDNMICASLLHDTLEDTDTTYNEIEINFNKEVADLVLELTNDKKRVKEIGKTRYLSEKMVQMSPQAFRIKLCDRLDNVEDALHADESFMDRYYNETLSILDYVLRNRDISDDEIKVINQIMKTIDKQNNRKLALELS